MRPKSGQSQEEWSQLYNKQLLKLSDPLNEQCDYRHFTHTQETWRVIYSTGWFLQKLTQLSAELLHCHWIAWAFVASDDIIIFTSGF